MKMMGDVQQYFIDHKVRNYYSVSISGYHIAEAGANPISQLAFTLSNGFTIVEYYLARGMNIDEFAPNLSFFFSNGLDAEYTVIGRVARRIWAIAMKKLYGGNDRSQKLKYHIQTSGRSLHAQEIAFNDIRTTLQAVIALFDNCQSLHTNAYDEAITADPVHARALNNLGMLLARLQVFDRAEAVLRRAVAIRSDYAGAHYNLGMVTMIAGKLGDAKTSFERVLEIDPAHVDAQRMLRRLEREDRGPHP